MNLDAVSSKHLNELEHLLSDLRLTMRKANLQDEPIAKSIHEFELEIGKIRRNRFDAENPEFVGY